MTELAWHTVRNQTIELFDGQTPRAQDEQVCIDVFQALPSLLITARDETAELVASGKVRYGWSFLAARLTRGATPLEDPTVDTGSVRAGKVAGAERWIKNAGLHFDRQEDVEDELFGRNGTLADYASDAALRGRLLELWIKQRREVEERQATETPEGEHVHRELQWRKARAAGERWATHD